MHARAVSIEYPGDLDRDLVLPVIVEEERFGAALSLVIAGAQPDRIDAAPVVFGLWMHLGIAVDLAGRGLKDARLDPLGQPQHVYRSMYACLGRLYRIALVVDGRCGTSEVVNFVDLDVEGEGNVMAQQLEVGMSDEMRDVVLGPRKEIVDADDVVTTGQETLAEVRPQEAGASGNQSTRS